MWWNGTASVSYTHLDVYKRQGGMVEVPVYRFQPFGQINAQRLRFAEIDAPAWVLAPAEVAKLVGPVEKAGLEDLLMQTGAVEAQGLATGDVLLQRRCV